MSSPQAQNLDSAGWRLAAGFARRDGRHFISLTLGEDFAAAHRGAAAVLTLGDDRAEAAEDAAQIAARLFTDGYYGLLGALSPSRAAARALEAANGWLYHQGRADPFRAGMAASLVAALFPSARELVVLHLGAGAIFLNRDGALRRLGTPHARRLRDGSVLISRGLGLDRAVAAETRLVDARPGDRLILLAGAELEALAPPAGLSPQALADHLAEIFGAALVIDIAALPADIVNLAENFQNLPIRPPPREGQTLDGFLIGKTIYRGAFTVLKRAQELKRTDDPQAQRELALKFPLPAMAQDQVFRAGFYREAWLGQKIRARNVADYLDLAPGRRSQLYLAMPYYRGQTLAERLRQTPPVGLQDGVDIALKLCDAIDSLAAQQVIHRDIKPENIFLCANGEVRLLDLGLAALPGLDDPQKDQLGGTTRYMAPELFSGAPPSGQTEIFSLGVTLYQMFSGGDFPFGRRENPILRSRPDLPLWLKQLLAQTISFDPHQRPLDAQEFRERLLQGLAEGQWRQDQARQSQGRAAPRRLRGENFWQAASALLAALCLFLALRR